MDDNEISQGRLGFDLARRVTREEIDEARASAGAGANARGPNGEPELVGQAARWWGHERR